MVTTTASSPSDALVNKTHTILPRQAAASVDMPRRRRSCGNYHRHITFGCPGNQIKSQPFHDKGHRRTDLDQSLPFLPFPLPLLWKPLLANLPFAFFHDFHLPARANAITRMQGTQSQKKTSTSLLVLAPLALHAQMPQHDCN